MKRLVLFILMAAPLLMCFQCGCDEPDTITLLRLDNATGEALYWSPSAQPWDNADCRWAPLPCSLEGYYDNMASPGEQFRHRIGGDYLLLVDADMQLRASWPTDSLPMADATRWVSDTVILESTNCNGILPTEYTHPFTLLPEDLLQ